MPTSVPVSWYLILSAILFGLGVAGFIYRRNIITVFMSIELMLNAVNLTFITFSYTLRQVDGHIFSFFCDGGGGGRGGGGPGHHPDGLQESRNAHDRRRELDEVLTWTQCLGPTRGARTFAGRRPAP